MSDNKSIVGSLLNRAKDAASGIGLQDVLEKGTQRAKNFGSATKTTLDITKDKRELDRLFCEIGKLCYEQNAASPAGAFAPLFEQVDRRKAAIAAKEAELESYKASFDAGTSGDGRSEAEEDLHGKIDDFESIVNQTESDGRSL